MPALNPAWLIEEFRAFERSLALRTALEMDLFTRIGGGDNTVRALSTACGASQRGVRALCDYLAIHGHLVKRGARYRLPLHTRLYLTTTSPAFLGSAARFLADDATVAAFCRLRKTVERGSASNAKSDWVEYARSMAPLAQPVAEFAASAIKLRADGPVLVLDIAAGHGLYGIAIAARNPRADIFALDSGAVLRIAARNAREFGVGRRFHAIAGDGLRNDLGGPYDLILAANFAHHLDRGANIRLFRKCRRALRRSGQMAVIDFLPNPDRVSPAIDASFALTLLATSAQGTVYTFQEYSEMLRAAGFPRVRRLNQHGYGRSILIASR